MAHSELQRVREERERPFLCSLERVRSFFSLIEELDQVIPATLRVPYTVEPGDFKSGGSLYCVDWDMNRDDPIATSDADPSFSGCSFSIDVVVDEKSDWSIDPPSFDIWLTFWYWEEDEQIPCHVCVEYQHGVSEDRPSGWMLYFDRQKENAGAPLQAFLKENSISLDERRSLSREEAHDMIRRMVLFFESLERRM